MASSSNRKSSSSASKASKPTFRRAGKGARPTSSKPRPAAPSAASARAAAPRARVSSVSTKPVRGSRPAPKPRSASPRAKRPVAAPKRPVTVAGAPRGQAPRPAQADPRAARAAKATRRAKRSVPIQKLTAVAATPRTTEPARRFSSVVHVLTAPFRFIALHLLSSGRVAFVALAVVIALAIGGLVIVNAPIFAATDIRYVASEHVSQETIEQLVNLDDGTTLLNVDISAIEEALEQNPWVSGVTVEREFPHTITITPVERAVAAIVYIAADNVAWALGDDGCWIAPVSLSVSAEEAAAVGLSDVADEDETTDDDDATSDTDDADTTDDADASADADATDAEATTDDTDTADDEGEDATSDSGSEQITGAAAARVIARQNGALLFTDLSADLDPVSGQATTSEVILAGLAYAQGFSDEFIAQIQSLSLSSVDAITAYLDSGVEVALGDPDDIETKELIVTSLLEQEEGVTYINVRTPDNYTFRSAPSS